MSDECFVEYRQRVIQRLAGEFPNGKCIFTQAAFFFKTDVLHDDLITQIAPVSGGPRFPRTYCGTECLLMGLQKAENRRKKGEPAKNRPAP